MLGMGTRSGHVHSIQFARNFRQKRRVYAFNTHLAYAIVGEAVYRFGYYPEDRPFCIFQTLRAHSKYREHAVVDKRELAFLRTYGKRCRPRKRRARPKQ